MYLNEHFSNNRHNHKNAVRADRKLHTIASRLARELERHLKAASIEEYDKLLAFFHHVLEQTHCSNDKIYSLHGPQAEYIGKGKEHKKYEFGNKVSIARTTGCLIVGAISFCKEHDSKTLEGLLEQIRNDTGQLPKLVACDRGYRGIKECLGIKILIPGIRQKMDSYRKKKKQHKLFCHRAAIEPTIGHLKFDHRKARNFINSAMRNVMNLLLAAAFNFKRAMNVFLSFILKCLFVQKYSRFRPQLLLQNKIPTS